MREVSSSARDSDEVRHLCIWYNAFGYLTVTDSLPYHERSRQLASAFRLRLQTPISSA
jgi:hypothetical protein